MRVFVFTCMHLQYIAVRKNIRKAGEKNSINKTVCSQKIIFSALCLWDFRGQAWRQAIMLFATLEDHFLRIVFVHFA